MFGGVWSCSKSCLIVPHDVTCDRWKRFHHPSRRHEKSCPIFVVRREILKLDFQSFFDISDPFGAIIIKVTTPFTLDALRPAKEISFPSSTTKSTARSTLALRSYISHSERHQSDCLALSANPFDHLL